MGAWVRAILFCLLVLLTPVDDAVALSTPGTEDDIAAAENNDYLLQQLTHLNSQVTGDGALPVTALTAVPLSVPGVAFCQRTSHIVPCPGPGSLYALMSLQR